MVYLQHFRCCKQEFVVNVSARTIAAYGCFPFLCIHVLRVRMYAVAKARVFFSTYSCRGSKMKPFVSFSKTWLGTVFTYSNPISFVHGIPCCFQGCRLTGQITPSSPRIIPDPGTCKQQSTQGGPINIRPFLNEKVASYS